MPGTHFSVPGFFLPGTRRAGVLNKHSSGLHCGSTILLEQLRTIDKSRLKGRIGMLSEPEMKRIDWALGISIGLAEGYD